MMTSQKSHAEKVYQARTKALRAPATKLYRVSVEGICEMKVHLVNATTPYEAMKKAVAAKYPECKLDDPAKAESYTNEYGTLEMQAYMRDKGSRPARCVWVQEAEVIS